MPRTHVPCFESLLPLSVCLWLNGPLFLTPSVPIYGKVFSSTEFKEVRKIFETCGMEVLDDRGDLDLKDE